MPDRTTLCANCEQALVESGRGWTHLDGYYRCTGASVSGDGWADPITAWSQCNELEAAAYEAGQSDGEQAGYKRGWNRCAQALRDVVGAGPR